MKLNKFSGILSLLIGTFAFISCSSDDTPSQAEILQGADGIITLKSGIGDWDAAYLTKQGYFCYNEDAFAKNTTKAKSEGDYSSITYMDAKGEDMVSLLATKKDNIPTQMVTKSGIVYFSFPNDTILELLYDDGKQVVMLDSIPYVKDELPGNNMSKGDAFKAALANAAKLLNTKSTKAVSTASLASTYGLVFKEVSNQPYVENPKVVEGINTNPTGVFTFTKTISDWYDNKIGNYVCNTLSLWTGNASFKVGGSSCTLSGTIWCPSNIYNDYGTYGIICDKDPSKLTLGNAEYEGSGYQSDDDLSYSVDFRGFKPNTTYYYKAYYKFNSSDHGSISPKYGSPSDQVVYDTTVKSFTTGDNILTVDVVMCIDVTGSMSGIINTVKKNAIGFYDSFNKCCEEEGIQLSSLNAQVVAFQDMNHDGSRWLKVSNTYSLPEEKTGFNNFVNALYADDGGDIPESGLEALETAFNKSDWGVDDGYHRQVVILWTDAPYLTGSYSSVSISGLQSKWNSMPSGRRLILFAPYGNSYSNGGDWGVFDDWKNVIHESDLESGFYNFEYILKSIIGELTSKAKANSAAAKRVNTYFRPNK